MPDRETLERADKDAREGKSPSTQAGEFVREEIHHIREGNMASGRHNKPSLLDYPKRGEPV
jgi:hypothetical protein